MNGRMRRSLLIDLMSKGEIRSIYKRGKDKTEFAESVKSDDSAFLKDFSLPLSRLDFISCSLGYSE